MKVIELLNKIANGEEVPEKIKWKHTIWEYNKTWVVDYQDESSCNLMEHIPIDEAGLNDEIEIIEESKLEKIPEVEIATSMAIGEKICARKINEIIDYIKNKENE